jgi:hypothetical protein
MYYGILGMKTLYYAYASSSECESKGASEFSALFATTEFSFIEVVHNMSLQFIHRILAIIRKIIQGTRTCDVSTKTLDADVTMAEKKR